MGDEKQQGEDCDGDQTDQNEQEHIRRFGPAAGVPVARRGAGGEDDLVLMLEIPGELASRRVAVARVAFESAPENFLQLWHDGGSKCEGGSGSLTTLVHGHERIGAAERHLAS